MTRKLFFFLPIFSLLLWGCNDDLPQQIPVVTVNEYIYLNNPTSYDLNFVGGWIYDDAGYNGLIIYRRYGNGDGNDWAVYERACPDHYSRDCGQLDVIENTFLQCGCDDDTWLMFDGSQASGTSTYQLVQYHVDFLGDRLHITN